jgi:hypothetical protein
MFILLITAAVNAPSLRLEENGILSCKKKITVRKIFVDINKLSIYHILENAAAWSVDLLMIVLYFCE